MKLKRTLQIVCIEVLLEGCSGVPSGVIYTPKVLPPDKTLVRVNVFDGPYVPTINFDSPVGWMHAVIVVNGLNSADTLAQLRQGKAQKWAGYVWRGVAEMPHAGLNINLQIFDSASGGTYDPVADAPRSVEVSYFDLQNHLVDWRVSLARQR